MDVAVFSTKPYDERGLDDAAESTDVEMTFFHERLTSETADRAEGHDAVCAFVSDELDQTCVEALGDLGVRLILMRCAGVDNVDLDAAAAADIAVAAVPEYSPHAVAEHALALTLALNRRLHRAFSRIRDQNFSLDGLQGFDMSGKTVGVVGSGKIGVAFARMVAAMDCDVVAFDPEPNDEMKAIGEYVELDELFERSRVVSLHCPLTEENRHVVDERRLALLPDGALVINTSRGALLDAEAAVAALESGQLGGLAIDVYENEDGLFFEDRSEQVLTDGVFARLVSFPNVLVTSHQAFFTDEALASIADQTIANATAFAAGEDMPGAM